MKNNTKPYDKKVYRALVDLGVPQKYKGFEVAAKTITAICKGRGTNLQKLYPELGYDPVTASRNVRSICQRAFPKTSQGIRNQILGTYQKVTEKEFLTAVAGWVMHHD